MIELNRIYNTDCLEGMRRMEDNSVNLIVTDPPYIIHSGFGGGIMKGKDKEYLNEINSISDGFDPAILDEMCRVMKRINIYLFCSLKQIILYTDYFVKQKNCNWNILSYHKKNPVPACGNKYINDTEYILFFREKGVRLYGNAMSKKTYFVKPLNQKDKKLYGHPTPKHLDIIETLIYNSSTEGQTVLDPFMGSGTTAVAAQRLKRNFVGFEIDKTYHAAAENRLEKQQQCLF